MTRKRKESQQVSQAAAEMLAEPLGRPAAGRARGHGRGRGGGRVAAFAAFPRSSASVPSPRGTLSGCGPGGREHSEFCISRGCAVPIADTLCPPGSRTRGLCGGFCFCAHAFGVDTGLCSLSSESVLPAASSGNSHAIEDFRTTSKLKFALSRFCLSSELFRGRAEGILAHESKPYCLLLH